MDGVFWLGIALGALLSFLASIAANLSQERIADIALRYKLGRISKQRNRALREYAFIEALHAGDLDRNIIFAVMTSDIVLYTAMMTLGMVLSIGLLGVPLIPKDHLLHLLPAGAPQIPGRVMTYLALASTFSALLCLYLCSSRRREMWKIANRLLMFDEYKNEVMTRWRFTDAEINEPENSVQPS